MGNAEESEEEGSPDIGQESPDAEVRERHQMTKQSTAQDIEELSPTTVAERDAWYHVKHFQGVPALSLVPHTS